VYFLEFLGPKAIQTNCKETLRLEEIPINIEKLTKISPMYSVSPQLVKSAEFDECQVLWNSR